MGHKAAKGACNHRTAKFKHGGSSLKTTHFDQHTCSSYMPICTTKRESLIALADKEDPSAAGISVMVL